MRSILVLCFMAALVAASSRFVHGSGGLRLYAIPAKLFAPARGVPLAPAPPRPFF